MSQLNEIFENPLILSLILPHVKPSSLFVFKLLNNTSCHISSPIITDIKDFKTLLPNKTEYWNKQECIMQQQKVI